MSECEGTHGVRSEKICACVLVKSRAERKEKFVVVAVVCVKPQIFASIFLIRFEENSENFHVE